VRYRLTASAVLWTMLFPPSTIAQSRVPERPLILTVKQFNCLRMHADRLKVGRRGAFVDYGICPPIVEDPFYPSTPNATKRRFLPADLDCLAQATLNDNRIAFAMRGRRVAVYLRPCGRR
jgi:hypothetical protein